MTFLKKILPFLMLGFISTSQIKNEGKIHLDNSKQSQIFMNSVVNVNIASRETYQVELEATGVSIAYDKKTHQSYILTNHHFCVEYQQTSETMFFESTDVILSNNVQYLSGNLKLLAMNETRDLCLLSTDQYVPPSKIATNYNIKKMEPVITTGSPFGVFPIVSQTYISNLVSRDILQDTQKEGYPLLLLSSTIIPGQSGSPVYNKKGEIIGLIMGYVNPTSEHIPGGIVISYLDIRDFLEHLQFKF